MATTPRGYPKFSLTDNADIASKLNAVADAVDTDMAATATTSIYSRVVQTAGLNVSSDGNWHTVTGWTSVQGTGIPYSSGVFTFATAGYYRCSGKIAYVPVASPTGFRGLRVYLNATLLWEDALRPDVSYSTHLKFAWAGHVAAGDTLHLETAQTQGATQALATSDGMNTVSIERAGA